MSRKSQGKSNVSKSRARRFDSTTLLFLGGLVLVSAAILFFIWFAFAPKNSGGTPKLQVNTERVELGKQIFDQSAHASFTLTNVGTGTLTLNVPRSTTLVEGC